MLRLTPRRMAAALALSLGLCMATGAQAQAKQLTLCWAAWDPANALVELVEGLHDEDRHRDEVRVRAVDELRRPLPQRTQFAAASCAT